jgi:hypothetical protein
MARMEDLPPSFRGGALEKLFTAFQGEISQHYNYWMYDIIGAAKNQRISKTELAYRVLMGHIAPAALLGIISRGRLPNLKELLLDEFGYFVGMYYFIGQFIYQVMQGYAGGSNVAFRGIEDVGKGILAKKPSTKALSLVKGIAQLTGIPAAQPLRTLQGVVDLYTGEASDLRRLIWSESMMRGLQEKPTKEIKIPKRRSGRNR